MKKAAITAREKGEEIKRGGGGKKRVEEKKVPAEQNEHMMRKKSATAVSGLDILKIHWQPRREQYRRMKKQRCAGVATLSTAPVSL